MVGHEAAGLRSVLPRRPHGFPHSGFTPPLPRLVLGVNRRGVLPPETGEAAAPTAGRVSFS